MNRKTLLSKTLLLLGLMLAGVGSAWAETTYKLEKVSSVKANGLYVFEQGGYVMNNTIESKALQTTKSYETTGLTGTETYVWKLESADNGFKMKNVSLSSYLANSSSKTDISFNNTGATWAFNFQDDGTVLIQNKGNSDRFLGYTTSDSHAYKAYAASNLSSYPHAIVVYQLVAENAEEVATVAAPTISPAAGAVVSGTIITLKAEEGCTLSYTTDGTDPIESNTAIMTDGNVAQITVTEAITIRAIALDDEANMSEELTAAYTIKVEGEMTVGFEVNNSELLGSTYTDWTFTNVGIGGGDIEPHGGSKFGSTGGKETCSITTKNIVERPGTFTCYISKTSTNTKASTWYIQVSEDGSTWTNVKNTSASDMDKGTWVEFTADLKKYTNVYVRLSYSGTSAVRAVDDITLTPAPKEIVSIGSLGYLTYANLTSAVSFNATGVKAYTAQLNGNSVKLTEVDAIPANTAVILNAEAGDYELNIVESADDVEDNDLLVSDGTVVGGTDIYCLADGNNGVGFYRVAADVTIPAGKAYLNVSAGARTFLAIGESEATAIKSVEDAQDGAAIYNLNGQRMVNVQKGLFIVGGKKVVVR